jgi:membrane-associated protease RseP (regulator of RpoE activity)
VIDPALGRYFRSWRRVELGTRTVLEGLVEPTHAGPSEELARVLARWSGQQQCHYWRSHPEGRWLVLVRETAPARERWWLHLLLLALTLVTASLAGAGWSVGDGGMRGMGMAGALAAVRRGLPFSLPLLAVLGAHESGHYVAARRYRVDSSPPYFLPMHPALSLIGTLGAFIRLRSPIFDRRTLFDIGVAGPLAGIVGAVPLLAVGLALSPSSPNAPQLTFAHQFVVAGRDQFFLGDSLLLELLRLALGKEGVLQLHPLAVAGWVGLFLTMLNLLPLAQFDGGHVTYAMFGRRQRGLAFVSWGLLLALGWLLWSGWLVWAALALAIGRGTLAHPRLVAGEEPLDLLRRRIGWAVIALFVLCFMPVPVAVP